MRGVSRVALFYSYPCKKIYYAMTVFVCFYMQAAYSTASSAVWNVVSETTLGLRPLAQSGRQ